MKWSPGRAVPSKVSTIMDKWQRQSWIIMQTWSPVTLPGQNSSRTAHKSYTSCSFSANCFSFCPVSFHRSYSRYCKCSLSTSKFSTCINRLALKSGIDSHPEFPQVGHSRPANTSQHLNSVYMVASSDLEME